jgi:hypothetical protein
MKNNLGQAMLESLIVISFISIFALAFIQLCLIVIDDISANEAAFTAMRSAAVTKQKFRAKEAKDRAQKYLLSFYPLSINSKGIIWTDRSLVEQFFKRGQGSDGEVIEDSQDDLHFIAIWSGRKKAKDYGGNEIKKQTVKIYYYTRVIFGSLFPNTIRNRRFQSSRNRMLPSPDEDFYDKAYPNAKKFKDELI